MWYRIARGVAALALITVTAACGNAEDRGGASVESAELALEQSTLTAQIDTLVADAADLNSRFDIGQGFEAAAEQLQLQLNVAVPCATVVRQGSTLAIVYDAIGIPCAYHGRQLAGWHTVRVMRNADNEVNVHHEFADFRDTRVSLSGSADVTWSRTSGSRRVEHAVSYTVLQGASAGWLGESYGDSTQLTLDDGVRINGLRTWSSAHGSYMLDMKAIEQRFADGVPQLGAYDLTTPENEALTLAFGRIDTDNIRVIIQGAQRDLSFVLRADGETVSPQ